jgi:peptide/nickel transport system substrate-binding protein
VVEEISVGLDPRGITTGFGGVWVALAGSNSVVRIDPETDAVAQSISVGNAPASLAVSADGVWVVNSLDDTVSRISPDTNSVVGTVGVGDGPSGIGVVQGTVWVASEAEGTLSVVEPGQTPVRTVVIGSVPQGLAAVAGDLWVSVSGTATSHRGGTLRLVSRLPPYTLDPAVGYDPTSWRVLHLLGDGLVAFEPIGGTTPRLVPDLATSMPTPTDGGRTYRFELRPGIRYSNGEVVVPSDFVRAFERGFGLERISNPDLYLGFFGGLVGGEACGKEPSTCDLSRGVVADDEGGTITFNFVRPDPEFLHKLTLPFAYPVPRSTPDDEQVKAGIPGTGPYALDVPRTRKRLTLVRNPHFRVWSPAAQPDGYVDRIEWTFRVEPQTQVEAVVAGDADVAVDARLTDGLEDLFVRFAAQVHTDPEPATYFVVLNNEVPPFDDVQVRQAVNLALDRQRIVQLLGGDAAAIPTCQQLPPNFPGYEPYCPYTMDPGPEGEGSWTAPDLAKAKRLVKRSGTEGMRVVFEYGLPDWEPLGPGIGAAMIERLEDLGYRGSVRPVSPREFFDPEFQMALLAWAADYPAASTFFVQIHTCAAASFRPTSGFCDPGIDAMIDRATLMQVDDPAAAGRLWAEIDREIVDQAPYLWLANTIAVEFVSERVGNYQRSPQWGMLLNQLWVQ